MATLASLAVKIDFIDNLTGGLDAARGKIESFGESMKKAGDWAVTRLTLPLVGLATYGVKAASDLQESMSAATTTFGTAGDAVLKWSENSAQAFGISQAAALTAATQYGAFFRGVGVGEQEAAKFSQTLVQAAADLSSFWNVPTGQSLADLQSGLAGQYEPLLKYGIVLNEAVVQQQALTMTGKTAADQLTQQEIIAARYTLILEGLGAAEGDRARTADSFSNQMRTLTAEFQNAAAQLGTLLLPMLTTLVGHLTSATEKFQSLSPETQKWLLILAGVAAVVGPILIAIGTMATALSALAPLFTALTGPIGLVVLAIAGLFIAYQTNFLGFADGVNWAINEVVVSFQHFMEVMGRVVDFFVSAWQAALPVVTAVFDALSSLFSDHVAAIQQILDGLATIIRGVMQVIKGIFTGDWTLIKEGVLTIVTGLKDVVLGQINLWLAGIKAYLEVFKTVFELAWTAIKDKVGSILGTMWASIITILSGIKDTAYSMTVTIGTNLGQGLIDGIMGMWDAVVGIAGDLVDAVIDKLSDIPGFSPIEHVGAFYGGKLAGGFAEGIEAMIKRAEGVSGALAHSAADAMTAPLSGIASVGAGWNGVTGAQAGLTVNGGITIRVEGAGDPDAVADRTFAKFAREFGLQVAG